jgi:hypothetical protein
MRRKIKKRSHTCAQKLIQRHRREQPPTEYVKGYEVFINLRKRNKQIRKGVVVKCRHKVAMYLIRFSDGKAQCKSVRNLASSIRSTDILRRAKSFQRIELLCQCNDDDCHLHASKLCSYSKSSSCCRKSRKQCNIPHHNRWDVSQFFANKTLQSLSNNELCGTNKVNTHDNLITHAMELNLLPYCDIPKDGNCMFHALAQALNDRLRTNLTQKDVRISVAEWLRENSELPNGEPLSNFVHNMEWGDYLNGLIRREWGDHLCLVALLLHQIFITFPLELFQVKQVVYRT